MKVALIVPEMTDSPPDWFGEWWNSGTVAMVKLVTTHKEAFALARDKQVDCVVANHLSDIAKNILQAIAIFKTCEEHNIHFVLIGDNVDTTDGGTFKTVRALDSVQRNDHAWRTKVGQQKALAEGRWLGGAAPFGFYSVNGKLRPNEREQAVLRAIKSMHERGDSLRTIAKSLNEQKIKTKVGKEWSAEGVRRVLMPRPYDMNSEFGESMD